MPTAMATARSDENSDVLVCLPVHGLPTVAELTPDGSGPSESI
jgi:hypothetical protein